MEEPTQIHIGFAKSDKQIDLVFIHYLDPVLNEWVAFGINTSTFRMEILKETRIDLIRAYHPHQLPLLVGFRKGKEWINKMYSHPGLGATPIIVQMLRDSGYTILPDRVSDDITPPMLDAAMRERPDLYQRKEMKE